MKSRNSDRNCSLIAGDPQSFSWDVFDAGVSGLCCGVGEALEIGCVEYPCE